MIVVILHKITACFITCFGEMNAPGIIGLSVKAFRFAQYGKAYARKLLMRTHDQRG